MIGEPEDDDDFRYGFGSASRADQNRTSSVRRRILTALAALAVLAVAATAWVALTQSAPTSTAGPLASARPSAATPVPTPTASAPAAATPAPPAGVAAPLTPEAVADTVTTLVTAAAELSPNATEAPDQLTAVASGAILDEIKNDQLELQANGWTRTGTPQVLNVTIVSSDTTATPATVVAQACVDSSDVQTLDSDGASLQGAGSAGSHRALNLFTFEQSGDSWRIIARSFPDETAC
ncbi:hypothetical protein [Microterricola pindariensis]|uniref:ARC6 IMS domain-containing protein n=1 Tax=Microterricola pindariensis TaxID=478010 RepID=A0ABX5AYC1_9MICO|nr:hypothetical protein [Microterricola pindariensis]PPL19885.1 hypothetical protein GY24_03795 [Microterricola pindariensis]